jgi:glutamate-5-semialdehyde dehydrogenase
MGKMGVAAREASRALARADTGVKNRALSAAAAEIRRQTDAILKANAGDVAGAKKKKKHDAAFIDRLTLTAKSVEQMAAGVEQVAALEDPVGRISERAKRPTGI